MAGPKENDIKKLEALERIVADAKKQFDSNTVTKKHGHLGSPVLPNDRTQWRAQLESGLNDLLEIASVAQSKRFDGTTGVIGANERTASNEIQQLVRESLGSQISKLSKEEQERLNDDKIGSTTLEHLPKALAALKLKLVAAAQPSADPSPTPVPAPRPAPVLRVLRGAELFEALREYKTTEESLVGLRGDQESAFKRFFETRDSFAKFLGLDDHSQAKLERVAPSGDGKRVTVEGWVSIPNGNGPAIHMPVKSIVRADGTAEKIDFGGTGKSLSEITALIADGEKTLPADAEKPGPLLSIYVRDGALFLFFGFVNPLGASPSGVTAYAKMLGSNGPFTKQSVTSNSMLEIPQFPVHRQPRPFMVSTLSGERKDFWLPVSTSVTGGSTAL